jgi:serine phosphatase RsbU (regulator of sigma subunit)/anti-sigma regulatory factor (Ser/Thr protein kinase)
MTGFIRRIFDFFNLEKPNETGSNELASTEPTQMARTVEVDIAQDDPILIYFSTAPGVVDIDRLQIDSPALSQMKDIGIKLVVPLVSQGELIGLLNLGPRRSEQDYSSDDLHLLNNLATQAAPALRVAQLVREQQFEARERERLDQELRVARVIQQTLLPKEVPQIPGYEVSAYWQPARAVSGDFYDFVIYPDGKLGIIVADVTDKGVPAALVMATTRTLLKQSAEQFVSPGNVLERANNLLVPDIPRNMFVTCLFVILDPKTGGFVFANAGHNLPIKCGMGEAEELLARGMPLGLIPGIDYEERESRLKPGQGLVLYSDGLTEAHNPQGEMFESQRLLTLLKSYSGSAAQIQASLEELSSFTGPDWEQEDDVTLVALERLPLNQADFDDSTIDERMHILADFEIESAPGNERKAMEKVVDVIHGLNFTKEKLEKLKTAVAESTMNAMEHGNKYRHDLPVRVVVLASEDSVRVRIRDYGGGRTIPEQVLPDIDAKLAGLQSPRGWGLFLIKNMVDAVHVHTDEKHHTVELVMEIED